MKKTSSKTDDQEMLNIQKKQKTPFYHNGTPYFETGRITIPQIKPNLYSCLYKHHKGPPLCTKDHKGHLNQHKGPTY
jgi:hypothetical protein